MLCTIPRHPVALTHSGLLGHCLVSPRLSFLLSFRKAEGGLEEALEFLWMISVETQQETSAFGFLVLCFPVATR